MYQQTFLFNHIAEAKKGTQILLQKYLVGTLLNCLSLPLALKKAPTARLIRSRLTPIGQIVRTLSV